MSRKVLFFTLALVALASLGAMAASDGEPLPPGAVQVDVWVLNGGNWVITNNAKAWNSLPDMGMGNAEEYTIDLINHVSVAQWVQYSLSGTRKDWRVLRPGTYASDSVTGVLKSNNAIALEFWAEDPKYLEVGEGVTLTIPKAFGISTTTTSTPDGVLGWLEASSTTEQTPATFTVPDGADLHAGYSFKIWERITVVESNSSSEYEGAGQLTIRLTNIKHWVDPVAGTWYVSGLGTKDPGFVPNP